MKSFIGTAAVLLSSTFAHGVELTERAIAERDLCSSGSTDDGGNWYCQAVHAVTYTGVGHTGTYFPVTGMDLTNGCTQGSQNFTGSLAPFDEEVSLHFRGPLQLKQLAVYTPGSSNSKRDVEAPVHAHAHAHAHAKAHEKREPAVGDWVTVTMDGKVVSWINTYSGETPAVQVNNLAAIAPAAAVAAATSVVQAAAAAATSAIAQAVGGSSSSSGSYGSSSSTGAWTRQGYYSSTSGTSQGLTFLNHKGGQGSGTFDTSFGNSLSYASADGQTGTSHSTVLGDVQLPSDAEVVVMTDKLCKDNACGYVRPGAEGVSYHGFNGSEKVFLMEFSMPLTGEKSASIYSPVDMPAIWMLNAQIPRTLQYGPATCSCWQSGCGEFDIFEVLAPGDMRCKSTIHAKAAGGDSDYFTRPTTGTMKAAVVMSNNQFHIKVLDSSTDFGSSLTSDFISSIVSSTNTQAGLVSLFALTS